MKYLSITLIMGIAMLCLNNHAVAQKNINRSFINGYYGGLPSTLDSLKYNNVFVERRDTGLHFSEKIASYFDFGLTQSSTYCDSSGKPLIVWQGCAILDATTMEPIYNGDFSDTKGTKDDLFHHCMTEPHNAYKDTIIGPYSLTLSTFFLDRGDPHSILLVYYRYENIPRNDTFYLYTATIDLTGSPEGKPAVTNKSYEPAYKINLNFGSQNAIRHANGKDWWIVFVESNSQNLYAVLYNEFGLNNPIISTISELPDTLYAGNTAISPDGMKYAYQDQIGKSFYILNFDRCSGKFSYFNQGSFPYIHPGNTWARWCEFAPGGRFFYTATALDVYQYDLQSSDFSNDWSHVASFDTSNQVNEIPGLFGFFGNFFRGYDGHLYLWSMNTTRWVHRIAFPDRKGPDVGWTQDYYHLQFWPTWFVPTLVDYAMGPLAGSPCTSHTADEGTLILKIFPNPTTESIRAEGLETRYDRSVVIIYDITGREVFSCQGLDLVHGIDVHTWKSGVYIIHIDGRPAGKFAKID